jgi:TonB family protein
MRIAIYLCGLLVMATLQTTKNPTHPSQESRQVTLALRTGEKIIGSLRTVEGDSVDFVFQGVLRSLRIDDLSSITFDRDISPQQRDASRRALTPSSQPANDSSQGAKAHAITIVLRTGEKLKGMLKSVDAHSVDFAVKDLLQSVPLDDVSSILFTARADSSCAQPTEASAVITRLRITYKEKAHYTRSARDAKIQGSVALSARFNPNGTISDIRVEKGLGFGLDEEAITAAGRIRFVPAAANGKPICVRAQIEFTFTL